MKIKPNFVHFVGLYAYFKMILVSYNIKLAIYLNVTLKHVRITTVAVGTAGNITYSELVLLALVS